MNQTSTHKPIKAGDYGKIIPLTPKNDKNPDKINTDGSKVLSLWSK